MRNVSKSKVSKILVPVTLLVCFAWTVPTSSAETDRKKVIKITKKGGEIKKAPRSDAPDPNTLVSCASTCDLSSIEDCICSLKEDFRETWTILDGDGEVICLDELESVEDVNKANYSITSWLKTLYAYNRGWFC